MTEKFNELTGRNVDKDKIRQKYDTEKNRDKVIISFDLSGLKKILLCFSLKTHYYNCQDSHMQEWAQAVKDDQRQTREILSFIVNY